jgi:hypothetical protein
MQELFEIMLGEIEERKERDYVILRFPFMVADKLNRNGRVYPKAVVEKVVTEAQKKIREGLSIYGSPGHPAGHLELDNISHRLLGVEMVGEKAYASAQVMPTTKGKNLMVILGHGGSLGVSSRGFGSVVKEPRGGKEVEVVQDDYDLAGVDFVSSPSAELYAGQKDMVEMLNEELRQGLRGDVFPSAGLLNEQQILNQKYYLAQSAGFKGSWEQFQLYEKNKDLLPLFEFARSCDYKGTFEDFCKLRRK